MASSVSFSGVGSGIDFGTIRDAIIAQRSRPITQMQSKVNTFNTRVDSLKDLNGLLATLTTATRDLSQRSLGTGRAATASDPSIASATALATASFGSLDLDVTRLATNLTQASRSYTSTSGSILAGGATTATFELRLGGASSGTEITIDSANDSLTGLRDAINAANAGVTASIVDLNGDGTQNQLVLTSTATGESGRVELVETTATGTGDDLTLRSLNPPDGDFSKLDAAFSINGLDLTRSTNTISDAVTGLTMTLKKAGSTSIEVTRSDEIKEKLGAFVTAYNAVQDFIARQYKKDAAGRPTGVLAGDSALRSVQHNLSSITGINSEDNGGSLKTLSQIGVTTTKDGRLELDEDVLNDRLQADAEDVQALLHGETASDTGIFQGAYSLSNSLSDSITGSVQTAINGYQSSVKNLNNSIADRTEAMNRLRESLTRRFSAADAAIGQLNGQGTSLSNIIKSLQRSSD